MICLEIGPNYGVSVRDAPYKAFVDGSCFEQEVHNAIQSILFTLPHGYHKFIHDGNQIVAVKLLLMVVASSKRFTTQSNLYH